VKWTSDLSAAAGFLPITGGTLTGAMNVPPGASGAEVPRAGEVVQLDPQPPAVQDIKQFITIAGHYPQVGFEKLTLNVAPTGSANPADPIGDEVGSGGAFDNLSSLITWAAKRINVVNLTIQVTGTINEPSVLNNIVTIPENLRSVKLTGGGTLVLNNVRLDFKSEVTLNNITINGTGHPTFKVLVSFYKATRFLSGVVISNTNSANDSMWVYSTLTIANPVTITGQVRGYEAAILRVSNALTINSNNIGGNCLLMAGGLVFDPTVPNSINASGTAKNITFQAPVPYITGRKTYGTGVKEKFINAKVAGSGWTKDPVTGLITQWLQPNLSPNVEHTVNYPIAFPNFVMNIQASSNWGSLVPAVNVGVTSGGQTNFKLKHTHSGNLPVNVLAIGY
jgi:hypothetical protein